MTCKHVRTQLVAFLDGELSPTVTAIVQEHLAACPDCTRLAEEYASVQETANLWEVEGTDVWEAIASQIAPAPNPVLVELQAMRSELKALRAEVIALREQVKAQQGEPVRKPAVLLPYLATQESPRHLV